MYFQVNNFKTLKKKKTKFEQNMKQLYRVHVYGTMNCIDFCAIILILSNCSSQKNFK